MPLVYLGVRAITRLCFQREAIGLDQRDVNHRIMHMLNILPIGSECRAHSRDLILSDRVYGQPVFLWHKVRDQITRAVVRTDPLRVTV